MDSVRSRRPSWRSNPKTKAAPMRSGARWSSHHGFKQGDDQLIARGGDAVFSAEPHDDAVARVEFQRPTGLPIGQHRIDGIAWSSPQSLQDRINDRVIEGR